MIEIWPVLRTLLSEVEKPVEEGILKLGDKEILELPACPFSNWKIQEEASFTKSLRNAMVSKVLAILKSSLIVLLGIMDTLVEDDFIKAGPLILVGITVFQRDRGYSARD
jgi:hypothetical protein